MHYLAQLREITLKGTGLSLLELLERCENQNCGDPRDKVYSLLGVAKDASRLGIFPDYRGKTVEGVYIDATAKILKNSTHLDVLHNVGRKGSGLRLPSWVPDWSPSRLESPLTLLFETDKSASGAHPFCAGGPITSRPEFNAENTRLTLSAIFIDVISYNSGVIDAKVAIPFADGSEGWLEDQLAKVKLLGRYGTEEGAVNAFWRTLVTNLTHDRCEVTPDYQRFFEAWASTGFPDFDVDMGSLGADANAMVAPFSKAVCYGVDQRSLSITKDGYLCLTPEHTKEGDQVVILEGRRTPFVVRQQQRQEEEYVLLGEAYAHELMKEEAIDIIKQLRGGLRRITLV